MKDHVPVFHLFFQVNICFLYDLNSIRHCFSIGRISMFVFCTFSKLSKDSFRTQSSR